MVRQGAAVSYRTRFKLLICRHQISALLIIYVHSTAVHLRRGVRLCHTLDL